MKEGRDVSMGLIIGSNPPPPAATATAARGTMMAAHKALFPHGPPSADPAQSQVPSVQTRTLGPGASRAAITVTETAKGK